MKRRGELQFLSQSRPENVKGFAVDPVSKNVIGQATIVKPSARVPAGLDIYSPEYQPIETKAFAEKGYQTRLPIYEHPAKVSWASANAAGRAAAAPHLLLAAMSERHNLRPVADEDLSYEGSRMSRSAAKRGLITPHPKNPEMKETLGQIYPKSQAGEELLTGEMNQAFAGAQWSHDTGRPLEQFSQEQMGRAHARVFARKPKPGQRPSYKQGTLF